MTRYPAVLTWLAFSALCVFVGCHGPRTPDATEPNVVKLEPTRNLYVAIDSVRHVACYGYGINSVVACIVLDTTNARAIGR